MDLYESIFVRKSVRAYEAPLDESTLEGLRSCVTQVPTLISDGKTTFSISSTSLALSNFKAPQYINIFCEDHELGYENVDFIWEQVSLCLSSKGIGSCWLGMPKIGSYEKSPYPFAVALAVGKPLGSPYRESNEFKRKLLADISSGHDPRLEAAHLAPSAMNQQTWFYDCHGGVIDIYRKILPRMLPHAFDRMSRINTGIGLAHLYVASKALKMPFNFVTQAAAPDKNGYVYVGTVCES